MTALRRLHAIAVFSAFLALAAQIYGAPRISAALLAFVVLILVVSMETLRATIRRLENRS